MAVGQEARTLTFSERLQEIRTGFERPFWIANISEIFERLSYYGAFASLALYLQEKLNFSTEQTGTLTGIFGGMVWFLAIFGGAAADRLGFRRALSMAYLILAAAYFLIGSIGASWLAPVRNAVPLGLFVGCHSHPSRARHLAGEALRGRHDGPGLEGERPLHRLLDLLHDGQHRRRGRTLFCFLGPSPPGRRERVPRGGAQRLRDVLCGPALLPGTAQARRRASAFDRDGRAELLRGGGQLPAGFARVGGRPVAAHRVVDLSRVTSCRGGFGSGFWRLCSPVSAGSCGSWCSSPATGSCSGSSTSVCPATFTGTSTPSADVEIILVTDGLTVICLTLAVNYLTRKIPAFQAVILGTVITSAVVADPRVSTDDLGRGAFAVCTGARRDHPGAPLLRIHFAARASRTAGDVHGLCVSADWHRLADRRLVWRDAWSTTSEKSLINRRRIWWSVTAVGLVTAAAALDL